MTLRALAVSLLFVSLAAFAQEPPKTEARTYTPADFVQFAPRTALDMLNRVPGFSIKQEDQARGLGEATGNVVINGQRLSGKDNDVVTELSRIPAANVVRIEIVDAATLNIPGLSGQVANVIIKSTGISGQWEYRPEFRSYYTDPLFTRFNVSVSGQQGPVQYRLGLDNPGNRSGAGGPTWIFDPTRSLMETRDEQWRGNYDQPRFSGRFVLDRGTSKGNLNLSYGHIVFDYLENDDRTTVAGEARHRLVTENQHGNNYEVGGDYEFDLERGRLKLIGLGRGNKYPDSVTVVTDFADQSPSTGNRFDQVGTERELIGRSEYRWKANGGEWQISAEGAFNSLDNTSRLFELQPDGSFDELPFSGGTAKVKEDRYQMIGSYGRQVTKSLTMKLSAGEEYSQLSQVGGGGTTRQFYRPKGELSAAWKVSPKTDVNVKLARRVGQLNFFDFLASVNLQDENKRAGNPDLVPEQTWELTVEGVRNLGKLGSTTLKLYGRKIDDIIDYIPIGDTGESPGNIDHATVYGLESHSTLNLDGLGWRGARVDLGGWYQQSSVRDPLTGEERPISNSLLRAASLGLRHDIPKTDWAWGASASYELDAMNYRLTEVGRFWEGPTWGSLYIENKNVHGLTVRAGMYNLFLADSMWDRTVYNGRRNDSTIAFVEHLHRQIGPIWSFQVRGKF
jgi:hypothetical protein